MKPISDKYRCLGVLHDNPGLTPGDVTARTGRRCLGLLYRLRSEGHACEEDGRWYPTDAGSALVAKHRDDNTYTWLESIDIHRRTHAFSDLTALSLCSKAPATDYTTPDPNTIRCGKCKQAIAANHF